MDSEEAKAEQTAMSIELNKAILDYRGIYTKLQSDPQDTYLQTECKRLQEHVHAVARKQKERFDAFREDAEGRASEPAEDEKTIINLQKTTDIKDNTGIKALVISPSRDTEKTSVDKQTSPRVQVARKTLLPRIVDSEKMVLDEQKPPQVKEENKTVKSTKAMLVENPSAKVARVAKVTQAKRERACKSELNRLRVKKSNPDDVLPGDATPLLGATVVVHKKRLCDYEVPLQDRAPILMPPNPEAVEGNAREETEGVNVNGNLVYETSASAKEKYMMALGLISVNSVHLRTGQREQKRATRQKKSTANHSQFVYDDWDDAKKKKKKDVTAGKQIPLSFPLKESESESDVETSPPCPILVPRKKKTVRIGKEHQLKSTPSEIESEPLSLATIQADVTPSVCILSVPKKKDSQIKKQVHEALPKERESDSVVDLMPTKVSMLKKKSVAFSKQDRRASSGNKSGSDSSSPEMLSSSRDVEAARKNFRSLLTRKSPTKAVQQLKKPKPSILQRSKSQPSEPQDLVEKLKSLDPFTPLVIQVPKFIEYLPNGEPKRHVPSILRSPGVTRKLALQNAEMCASAAAAAALCAHNSQPGSSALSLTIPGLPSSLTIQRISDQKSVCCVCHKSGTDGAPNGSVEFSAESLTACGQCANWYHLSCSASTSTSSERHLCLQCDAPQPNNSFLIDDELRETLALKQLRLQEEKVGLEGRAVELSNACSEQSSRKQVLLNQNEEWFQKIKSVQEFISTIQSERRATELKHTS